MRTPLLAAALCLAPIAASAQWQILDAHTTADLRGIDSVGNGVAWASGTNGTVLRTEDGGYEWQLCAIPPGAAKLDFRGIQAFDNKTAIVMSSGKGELSRLYKTTDGCQTWKKVFDDPDQTGFFDSLRRVTTKQMYLLGDPVDGKFAMFTSRDAGDTWYIADDPGLEAPAKVSAFAASNSAFASVASSLFFGTGGASAKLYALSQSCSTQTGQCTASWKSCDTPVAHGSESTGVFSMVARINFTQTGKPLTLIVVVGGDYSKSNDASNVAAWSQDDGVTWTLAAKQPGGYRSAVAFERERDRLIAVGPNGTDISTDDGRNWRALKPSPSDQPEADQHWNALSLPYVVGPHGRIGKLEPDAVKTK